MSDAKYVVDGISSMALGHGKHLLDGPDADLWGRMAVLSPRARWTPSHRTLSQAREQGLDLGDWIGNNRADRLAGEAVLAGPPPPGAVTQRALTLRALWAAQAMMAAINERAMIEGRALPRKKTTGRRLRPLLRLRRRPKRKATGRLLAVRPQTPTVRPAGLCAPVIHNGPLPAGECVARRTSCRATCTECGRSVSGCNRWPSFLTLVCRRGAGHTSLTTGNHQLTHTAGHWQCVRCGRTCDGAHRASTARTSCPVPIVTIGGVISAAGSQWLSMVRNKFDDWRNWRRGTAQATPPAAPMLALSPWLAHKPLRQQGLGCRQLVCARCGMHALRESTLLGTPCRPGQAWPRYSRTVLAAGSLDIALGALTPAAQGPAIANGWRPAAVPEPPAANVEEAPEAQPAAAPPWARPRPPGHMGDEPLAKAARLDFLAARRRLKAQDAGPPPGSFLDVRTYL